MQPVPQDLLKEYVQSQHFTSTTEIMAAMKEMFREVIQTVMEVEMDEELGRERCERSDEPEGSPRNYRNGYTKKTVKTQLGEVDINVFCQVKIPGSAKKFPWYCHGNSLVIAK